MKARDPHYVALGPRVRVFDEVSQRVVAVRKTHDGRVPGVDSHQRGRPIYSVGFTSGELGELHWYMDRGTSTWTVTTRALCGAFHYETGAVIDDFGALVLPEVIAEENWHAARRAARGVA